MPAQYLGDQYTTAIGTEETVNTTTAGEEVTPQVSALDGGGWVVTWQEYWSADIFAQMYDASGAKVGSEITVTTYGSNPQITGLVGGGFVVSYWNYDWTGSYTNGSYAQMFDDSGTAIGGEIPLDSDPSYNCIEPKVVALDSGGFMAVWKSSNTLANLNSYETGIVGRVFDATGTAVTGDFTIGAEPDNGNAQVVPDVTKLSDGNVLVVWHNAAVGGTPWNPGYVAQIVDQSGALVGSQMTLATGYLVNAPSVAALTDGFAFTWVESSGSHTSSEIFVSIFENDGTTRTIGLGVDTHNYSTQTAPQVVGLEDGGFVVMWLSNSAPDLMADASYGISGQRFDENGTKVGNEFLVNSYSGVSDGGFPSVTLSEDNQLVAVWSTKVSPDDIEAYPWSYPTSGISMQILDPTGTPHAEQQWIGTPTLTAIGDEQRVNDVYGGAQHVTHATSFDDGSYMIGWSPYMGTPQIKIYNADGTERISQIIVDSAATGTASSAVLGNQTLVNAWAAYDVASHSADVFFNIMDSDGDVLTGPIHAVSTGANNESNIKVTSLQDGGFLLTWTDFTSTYNLSAQFYDATGTATTSVINVISSGNYIGMNGTAIAQAKDGTILVTWDDGWNSYLGGYYGVGGQMIDTSGSLVGSYIEISGTASTNFPEVKSLANGNFVISWSKAGVGYESRIFDTSGTAVSSPLLLTSNLAGEDGWSSIVPLPDGGYFVFFNTHFTQDRFIGDVDVSRSISGRRVDANNNLIGTEEFLVNTNWLGPQSTYVSNTATFNEDTGVVTVSWNGYGTPTNGNLPQDGFTTSVEVGISSQRFQLEVTTNLPITGTSGADSLRGRFGHDSITGAAGNDTIVSGRNNDTIYGGAGNDSIHGELDNDLIYGDADNDTIYGDEGNDTIHGGTGTDSLLGGDGNDIINGDDGNDTISGGDGADVLNGGNNNDSILGGAGNDTIDGGVGTDTMLGGAGDDTYTVNATADVVTESASEGTDLVLASATYTLGANVENLTLTGSGNINATGNTLNNVLTGNSGNNTLNGGTGNDTMIGGAGNDIYVVNAAGDVVTENASAGADTVQSSITYTLGTNLENLTLTGSGHISGTGNSVNNSLTGNSGNNTLDGGAGNDTMAGGAGNDTYIVDATGDVVTEAASAGTDTVQSSVSYTLAANVENLTLTGSGNINATGNSLANTLIGNSGNNVLQGAGGVDVLTGGSGADIFTFTNLADSGVSSGTRDSITDFAQGTDKIDLTAIGSFTWLGNAAFTASSVAEAMYYNASGKTILAVDQNGDGVADMEVEFVTLVALANSDFV